MFKDYGKLKFKRNIEGDVIKNTTIKNIDVAAAFIFKNNKILISRRKPDIANAGKWEFPGGKIKPLETPKEAIVREIEEEFGLDCEAIDVIGFVETKIEEKLEIKLYGIYCISEGEIQYLNDHDKISWCEIDHLDLYELSKADILLLSKYKSRLDEILKGKYENYDQ